MTPVPKNLIIVGGHVCMADGSDSSAYLLEWQTSQNVPDGTPIKVADHEGQVWLEQLAAYGCIG